MPLQEGSIFYLGLARFSGDPPIHIREFLVFYGDIMTKLGEHQDVHVTADNNGAAENYLVHTFNDLRDDLLSTLLFVLGNRDDAHDAAQETFVKCWGARDQLEQILNLRAWIFRVAFNTAKDMQRSAWNRRVKPLKAEDFTMAGKEPPPTQMLEYKESLERVRRGLLHLREEEKEVFLLRQNGDMTYDQIAELRRCPVGTVKTQMRSALEKLRKQLAQPV